MQNDPGDFDLERKLEDWAAAESSIRVSSELTRSIQATLNRSLTAVKPVPSQGTLWLVFMTLFMGCAGLLIMLTSRVGIHLMTPVQLGGISVVLIAIGILFVAKLVEQMIPGSQSRVSQSTVLTFGGIGLFGGLAILFPWQSSPHFVSEGWPCAVLELAAGVPVTGIFWLLARRGTLFASAGLGATLTGIAALVVLIPLQFQCMFQQAPHLLVWHGGAALLLIGLGAILGRRP